MCGIAGIVGPRQDNWIEDMCDAMGHRGPNGRGRWEDAFGLASFGHVRLSILDLDGGIQPMTNERGWASIVYNGEIFNAPALRKELEREGVRFRTKNSDTEVLLKLYEQYGLAAIDRLNGMFAFAIHDRKNGRIVLCRDRVGIKPLYYARQGERFAFASELKALLTLPWIGREIDKESFSHYLSLQFVPAPRTIFSTIKKLPAGHLLLLDLSGREIETRRYWQLAIRPQEALDREQWIEGIREELDRAIRDWTLSDVPIACSLSGGLDSSYLASVVGQCKTRVNTFTVGFLGTDEEEYNELPLARMTADWIGANHTEIIVEPRGLLDSLDAMVQSLDEPYGGGLPSWFVYAALGKQFKVAMTGTGGDELFGNYLKWLRYESSPAEKVRTILNQTREKPTPEHCELADRYPGGFFFHRYLTAVSKRAFMAQPFKPHAWDTEILLESIWNSTPAQSPRDKVAVTDFTLQLPEEFLLVTDRFSMAHSVEARVPFLDHQLVEKVFTVPAAIRTRPDNPKWILREIVRSRLPQQIVDAPKRGFIVPLLEWTRGALASRIRDALHPERLKRQGLFDQALWRDLVVPHLEGKVDFSQQIWTVFMFQVWYDHFVG